MVSSLRHKRAAALLTSLPFPTSASTPLICDSSDEVRWSGNSLGPRDGYSGLFTSGLLGPPMPSPTLSSSPSPSQDPAKVTPSPTSGSPKPSSNRPSPVKTTHHRRRSSIIPATPSSKAAEIDRSLTETIRNLKLNATTRRTAVDLPESRWSSSDGSANESEDAAFFKARKSSESIRSRATSNKSKRSVKSRKSEETDCKDVKEVPPVPSAIPLTPGRSRRMMDGLVKRLGLTPRKNKLGPPPTPAPTGPLPSPPLPVPTERRVLPKKGSLSNLRSALTKKASSTALRTVRSTANLTSGSAPLLNTETPPLPLPQPKWRDLNLPSPKMRDLELSDGCFPPMTPSRDRRNPKTSIGQPHLQPSTSPSAFLKDLPRPAPGRPKVETSPTLPSSDWAHPLPVPDFAQSPGNMTLESPHIGTPISTTGDLVANYETPSAALTARAARADSTLKPRRLVSLLPRQQKINLGIQTPPSTGLRTKKSTGDVSALLKSTPHQNRSAIGLPTPGPTPLERHIDTSRPRSRRDPLGIIRRCDNIPLPSPSQPEDKEGGMPFPSGARDGWSTPAPTSEENKENEGLGYIGAYSARESALAPAFDFSASPVKTVSAGMTSKASVESEGLPSEEWELEAYLRELERVDQEKSGRVRDGVRAGGVV